MTFSWKVTRLRGDVMVASLPITWAATIATASGTTGFTLPGMMLLPGCRAGSAISPRPASGPLFIQRRSLAIFIRLTATTLQLTGKLEGRVLGAQRLEVIAVGSESDCGGRCEPGREHVCEARIRVDAGANRGPALGERQEPRLDCFESCDAVFDLRAPAAQLLRKRDRHGVHEMRSPRLYDVPQLVRLALQDLAEVPERRQQFLLQLERGAHVNGRRDHVVAALTHVDVIVRMHGTAEMATGQVADHLVRIHVGAGARSGLEDIDGKVRIVPAVRHLERRLGDRIGGRRFEQTQFLVGNGRGVLDEAESPRETRVASSVRSRESSAPRAASVRPTARRPAP